MLQVTGADSVPVPRAWVVLHEVRMDGGGPVDSLRSDADGGYRFLVARPDTTALYMASAVHQSLTYFTQVVTGRDTVVTLEPLVVYDTSSTAPPVTVAQRHIIVRGSGEDGRRTVLELVALANDGDRTRIAGDPPRPTWVGRLPSAATAFTVGQGDVSAEAVATVGDSVVVTAPVPPGMKQLVFTYEVPAGRELTIPIDQPSERILVLLEDTTATVVEGPLTRRGVQVFNDAQFVMFDGIAVTGGEAMVFAFERRTGLADTTVILIVVGCAALALLLAVPLLSRRRPAAAVVRPPDTPEGIARAIALLDAHHERQTGRTPADEEQYQRRRTALKAQLTDALARRAGGP